MKRICLSAILFSSLLIVSCNKGNQSADSTTETAKDSVSVSNSDTLSQSVAANAIEVIVKNEGKYPSEINLFNDTIFIKRVKTVVGSGEYEEIVKNFNVETPIVSEEGIYKFTGCQKDNCPAFDTNVFYDSKNDNLNVVVNKNGEKKDYIEKVMIKVTESLKNK